MRPNSPWSSERWLDLFWLCSLSSVTCLLGCGDSRSKPVQVDDLGEACGEANVVVSATVDVDDDSSECQAVCLHGDAVASPGKTSAGQCSCRCDGPAATGPFCACGAGFTCEHLISDLDPRERELAGSYCVQLP
jgi:hypothetical protein